MPVAQAETIALPVPDRVQFEARLEAKPETVAAKNELRAMESRLNPCMLTFVLAPVTFVWWPLYGFVHAQHVAAAGPVGRPAPTPRARGSEAHPPASGASVPGEPPGN